MKIPLTRSASYSLLSGAALTLILVFVPRQPDGTSQTVNVPFTPSAVPTTRAVLPSPVVVCSSAGELDPYLMPTTFALPDKQEEQQIPADWYAKITQDIDASEYHIRWQDHAGAFQSPNRRHDLRITYHADGFDLKPRVNDSAWAISFKLDRIGRENAWQHPSAGAALSVEGSRFIADHGRFAIDYHNSEVGMRQNFTLFEKPQGDGPLEVRLKYKSRLLATDKGGSAIAFCEPGSGLGSQTPIVWYKDLRVWDANGDALEATASLREGEIVLEVHDERAEYPIVVDPLSTTADWTLAGTQINAEFGSCVSSAGDVNGDGYGDVIVGAPNFDNGQTDEGRAFVFHGSSTGLSSTAAWNAEGDWTYSHFGLSVSTAGDVNGDGYSDIIIGAPHDNVVHGRAFVYQGSSTGLTTSASWTAELGDDRFEFGTSVSSAGDVNGDGFSDVIVGIPNAFNWVSEEEEHGSVRVYHGSLAGLNSSAAFGRAGPQRGCSYGYSVSGAGDLNGDGYADVIIGAPAYQTSPFTFLDGHVQILYGSIDGIDDLTHWEISGDEQITSLGGSVSTAGDVNGDGYADALIGGQGGAAVFMGGSSGVSATATWTIVTSANLITCVSCAGDVNGDGFSDVLVGDPGFPNSQSGEGRALLYIGSASGLTTSSWSTEGGQVGANYGRSVSSAGDVNGDGFSDVIVGAPLFMVGPNQQGSALVFHGAADGLSQASNWTFEGNLATANLGWSIACAGDVNGDGYSDAIIGAPRYDNGQTDEGRVLVSHGRTSGTYLTDWSAESNQATSLFGSSVCGAGDVNGDGYDDVIIGAYYFDNGQTDEGRVFVYHGSSSGLSTTASWIKESDQADAWFGGSVSSAGDVNGDGYGDVIVGADGFDNGETDEGRVFVFHGSAAGLPANSSWSADSDQAGAAFGWSVATAGDVNGDGYGDVIIGAPKFDDGQTDEGRASVFLGSAAGLALAPGWIKDGNQVNSQFGKGVASAGDVNGDSYSDVIIGAGLWGTNDEGVAAVYVGSPQGLAASSQWSYQGENSGAQAGFSVRSAGDVDGDGYSDVIVGAPYDANGQTDEGRAVVYHGSPSGIVNIPEWVGEIDQTNCRFGWSVSTVGDMNGDGYSDVIVGAPYYASGQANEGRVTWFHGNGGGGRRNNMRHYNTNLTSPISASNFSNAQFGAGLFARPFLGRQRTRLLWETRIQGQPFSSAGGGITTSTANSGQQSLSTLTALTGTELKNAVVKPTSPSGTTVIKTRARLRYDVASAITGQQLGPWRYSRSHMEGRTADVMRLSPCETTPTVRVAAKVFLEGPFVSGTGLMSDQLRSSGLFPLTEPYTALGLPINGPNTINSAILATTGNNALVDWVLVELRDAATGATVLERRAALVQRDGDVVALDGINSLGFCSSAGSYRVVVRHRNHLGCMTSQGIALTSTATAVDFTSAALATYGTDARKMSGIVRLLWAGNTNGDASLKYTGSSNDRDPILLGVGSTTPNATVNGYLRTDVNMDGAVKYTGASNDRDPILVNVGSTTPNNVRLEQLP